MATGGLAFLPLRGKERFAYERALDLPASTGLTVDLVVTQFTRATTVLKGVTTFGEAADFIGLITRT